MSNFRRNIVSQKLRIILDPHPRQVEEIFSPNDLLRLEKVADIAWGKDEPITPDFFDRQKESAFAVITGKWRYGSIEGMHRLRAIMEVGGCLPSSSELNYDLCFSRKVRVLSCAPAFGPMVAEMALGMAIDAAREISLGDSNFKQGTEKYLHAGNKNTFTLFDKNVGFIGCGNLAGELQHLLSPFRCKLKAYDPWLPDIFLTKQGVDPVDLRTLMSSCRLIFVLAIPSEENRGMLSRELMELIPATSVLLLMSRAHLVDFDALTNLLCRGKFKAAIDVFPDEPLDKDHPIRKAPGTILSAHRAGSVLEELKLIGKMVVADIQAMAAGLPPRQMQGAEPEIVCRL
jgi:phosphoglycerate dehydrogenase-like enzyme